MQAARQPKSLDTPLKGNVNSYTEEGDLLVDSIAADNGVDEKALDLQRCDSPHICVHVHVLFMPSQDPVTTSMITWVSPIF